MRAGLDWWTKGEKAGGVRDVRRKENLRLDTVTDLTGAFKGVIQLTKKLLKLQLQHHQHFLVRTEETRRE